MSGACGYVRLKGVGGIGGWPLDIGQCMPNVICIVYCILYMDIEAHKYAQYAQYRGILSVQVVLIHFILY